MRTIARFTGSQIIGINNNAYQISRGTLQNHQAGLSHLCSFHQSDFMHLNLPNDSHDGAYAIEATCHAPDKIACFQEIFRVLKPGAVFAGYEWCMTDKYNPSNPVHKRIKHAIEEGDGLPDLVHTSEVVKALEASGFQVTEAYDLAPTCPGNEIPWYSTLVAFSSPAHWLQFSILFSPSQFLHSKAGIAVTRWLVRVLEFVHIAPKGTSATHSFLSLAPPNLAAGGKLGIFTPMFYFRAVKPA
jgi:sterol 24-C-methyltransferase